MSERQMWTLVVLLIHSELNHFFFRNREKEGVKEGGRKERQTGKREEGREGAKRTDKKGRREGGR